MIIGLSIALALVWWLGWLVLCQAGRDLGSEYVQKPFTRYLALVIWPFLILGMAINGELFK